MFESLKTVFSPRSVVGLQLEETFIGAVQVSNPLRSPTVERVAWQEVKDSQEIPAELEPFFQREGFAPEVLVTSLPTSVATFREIQVDFKNPKKLEKIIKYQMEPHLPYPVEDMLVNFFPPEPNRPVLTMGIRKETLSRHLAALAGVRMNPQAVSLEDSALFSLFLKTCGDKSDSPVGILHVGGRRQVIQVIRGKRLEFIRIIPSGREPVAHLEESLRLYGLRNTQPLSEILVTGRAAPEEGLAGKIEESTGIRCSVWRPFDQVRHGLGDLPIDLQARLSVSLGLALGMVNGQSGRFNLRREEFAIKESLNQSRLFISMLCGVALFLGLFTFDLHQKVSIREKAHEALNTRIRQIFSETFPGTPSIVKGKEAAQMSQRISAETAHYRWLEEVASEGSVLDALLALTKRVAGLTDVRVDNIAVEPGKINLDGRASSFKTVDNLKGRLGENGAFRNVKLVGAKMDSREQAVLFNFVLEKVK